MANPEWTYNLLATRSESVIEYLRSNSILADLGKLYALRAPSLSSLTTAASDDGGEAGLDKVDHYRSVQECILANAMEGAVIGAGLAGIVSGLPLLLKGKFGKAGKSIASTNNLRVALFFALFMATHNTTIHLQARGRKCSRTQRVVQGLLAAAPAALLPKRVRQFLVYLLLTRSMEVVVRTVRSHRANNSTRDVISPHESVGLTMSAMAVITTAWFGWPHLVPKNYLHFLDNISNIHQSSFRNVGKLLRGDVEARPDLQRIIADHQPCCVFHNATQEPCPRFVGRVWLGSLVGKTIPFYMKIYQVPLLLHMIKARGRIDVVKTGKQFGIRVGRSALFLSVLNGVVGGVICAVSNQGIIPHQAIMPLSGALSGLSLYIEDPARRLELALYMFGQAIQISVNAYRSQGLWAPPGTDLMACAASIATLSNAFAEQIDEEDSSKAPVMRKTYVDLLGRILDTPTRRHSFKLGGKGRRATKGNSELLNE